MSELMSRYDLQYEDIIRSKNPADMEVLGEATSWLFYEVAKAHPELAEKMITKLESRKWNNYLSEEEAKKITSHFVNQDGGKGPHWDYETFKAAVIGLGAPMAEEPLFNCWALWTTANMLYSDHHASIAPYVPKEDYPKFFYTMAIETLKDPDRPKFIRPYFKL